MENPEKESFDFRLSKYYLATDLAGLFVPLIIGAGMFLYPQFFPWIIHPLVNLWAFLIVVVFQATDFFLFQSFHKKLFFNLSRYVYVIFFTVLLYTTGGTQSGWFFMMMFPLMVSAVDLNPIMTKRIGWAVCIAMTALIFFEPASLHDPIIILYHFLHVAMFALLSYFMYKLVRETLLQKYEKEETNKKFIKLIELDQLKNDFLSVAQHQLRTPLAGVKWTLESLNSEKGLSDEMRQTIKSGIDRMEDAMGIVNEMLKTVEEGKGNLVLNPEPADIVGMVRKIIDELNYVAMHKESAVHFSSPQSIMANVDVKKLKPSFTNIIDNALKYSPKGHVQVTLADNGSDFTLTVKDDGIGISPDDMPFIFNRLFRGKNAVFMEPDESGVGLYTAKKMIELHKGTIALESILGKGTTITVHLPK